MGKRERFREAGSREVFKQGAACEGQIQEIIGRRKDDPREQKG